MAQNEVKVKVSTDQKKVDLSEAKKQSADLRSQVESDSAAMRRASEQLEKSKNREADASGRVRVADLKLKEVRDNAKSTAAQLAAAEERLSTATRKSASAISATATATEKLAEARKRLDEKPPPEPEPEPEDKGPRFSFDKSKSFIDKGQLLSEAKSYGMQAGALLGGSMAAGLSTVGATGLFVGIAAAAQSSNPQVAAAYSKLWGEIKAGAQEASADLSQDFVNLAESLGRTFNDLRPEMQEAFTSSKPMVADLADGVDRLAKSAMPGLVTATKAGAVASNGLADMMESSGRGVANFFTESSAGAHGASDAFRAFGVVVERLGSFVGRILADIANDSGTVWPALESAVDSTASAVEQFAHVALPGIGSGASFALTSLGLLMNLVSSLLGVLGPIVPVAVQVASSLKLIDMVSFGQVTKSWGDFKAKVGEGEGVFGKIKAGAGGLLSTLGPVGLAAGLVTVGLAALSKEQQDAAGAAAAHAQRIDTLSDALRKSKGAIDSNVKASAAQALENMAVNKAYQDGDKILKSMTQGAHELNINQSLLTDAYLGQGDAMGQLNHQLDTIMSPFKDYNDMVAHANPEEQKRWMLAELMKDTLNKQGGEFATAAQKAADFMQATGQAAATTGKLAAEFGILADKEATAEDKLAALMKVMDTLAGRKPDVEQATEAWEKFIDTFTKKDIGFQDKGAGAKKYVQGLIDMSGQINLTTDDGRKLYDVVREGEKDFSQTAVAMKDSGASVDDVRAKLDTMRGAFIASAMDMGFTRTQAEQLANKYGLIPANVSTLIFSNLSPEIQKALELGGTIKTLPNGQFVIIANTGDAQRQITKLVQDNSGHVITIHVNTVTGAQVNVSNGSFSRLKAAGGPVAHAAEGGARTGPVLVNEQGQEGARLPSGDLITLPMGSDVVPASNMAAMAAGCGPARVEILFGDDGSDLGQLLVKLVQKYVRVVGGGDVQLALGRAA